MEEAIEELNNQGYLRLGLEDLPNAPPYHFDFIINEGRVGYRNKISKLDGIEKNFSDSEWERAENYPQIGNFLKLRRPGYLKGSAIHQLMVRACETNKETYEMFFIVNGKPIRFSAEEFTLVSGLSFGDVSDEDQRIMRTSKLQKKCFPHNANGNVPLEDILTRIKEFGKKNSQDKLKLLYVAVVTSFLLLMRKPSASPYIFAAVDNEQICSRYPWGKLVWDATMKDVLDTISPMEDGMSDVRTWNASGCPHIFMYWMLEAIPGLAEILGYVKGQVDEIPRMLRWKTGIQKSPNCATMLEHYNQVKIVIPRLMPTQVELGSSYYRATKRWFNFEEDRDDAVKTLYKSRVMNEYVYISDTDGVNVVPSFPPGKPPTGIVLAPKQRHTKHPESSSRIANETPHEGLGNSNAQEIANLNEIVKQMAERQKQDSERLERVENMLLESRRLEVVGDKVVGDKVVDATIEAVGESMNQVDEEPVRRESSRISKMLKSTKVVTYAKKSRRGQ